MLSLEETILKYIAERQQSLSRVLIDGAAADFIQYSKICGEIRGLTSIEVYIKDLVKNMEFQDE
jgi:hypothetical protein